MTTKTGTRVIQPQAVEEHCWQSSEARRDMEWIINLEPLEGVQPCWHLDFRLLDSRTVREDISVKLPGL